MIDKPSSPEGIGMNEIISWLPVIGLSILGAAASFQRKIQSGHVRKWNFTEFVGEVTISGFVGIVAAMTCESMGVTNWKYPIVGILAHMGARGIFMLEKIVSSKAGIPADVAAAVQEPDHAA